jgi:hypothetical protein
MAQAQGTGHMAARTVHSNRSACLRFTTLQPRIGHSCDTHKLPLTNAEVAESKNSHNTDSNPLKPGAEVQALRQLCMKTGKA